MFDDRDKLDQHGYTTEKDTRWRDFLKEPPEAGRFFLGRWVWENEKDKWSKQHLIAFGKREANGYCVYDEHLQNNWQTKSLSYFPFEWVPSPSSEKEYFEHQEWIKKYKEERKLSKAKYE
ncbi:MAG: hypothetical protein UU10_C0022G0005 [Parcubacteria group bacterium GW2011_GWF1_40_6]|nr:MAG: hypothetical protein UU10_C0022G0005 [Parcubacteria group bacterium GW2011_GWF1_40_6]HLA29303.1 hypothetical protein [Syntrophales bacterium]